jgi:hypothetical protein
MPATAAIDDGFPTKASRYHFYEILGSIFVIGSGLMTYWYIFD